MFQSSPIANTTNNIHSNERSTSIGDSPFTFESSGPTPTPLRSSTAKRGRSNTRGGSRVAAANTGLRKLKRGVQDQMYTFSENVIANHIPSPLWQDSVVTYAELDYELGRGQVAESKKVVTGGTKNTIGVAGGSAGVLRQIKSERAGKFEAEGVVLGVRFLIGGV